MLLCFLLVLYLRSVFLLTLALGLVYSAVSCTCDFVLRFYCDALSASTWNLQRLQ